MNVKYKVAVTSVSGVELMLEYFDTEEAKDAYVASVLKSEESVLDGLQGVDAATVEVSELCYGSWVTAKKKLVRIR